VSVVRDGRDDSPDTVGIELDGVPDLERTQERRTNADYILRTVGHRDAGAGQYHLEERLQDRTLYDLHTPTGITRLQNPESELLGGQTEDQHILEGLPLKQVPSDELDVSTVRQ
jgi:hypothetical protein